MRTGGENLGDYRGLVARLGQLQRGAHACTTATDHLVAITHLVLVSTFLSNLVISLFDKCISGFAALAIVESRATVPSAQGADPARMSTSDRLDPGSEPHS